jgi:hypothetical protein
MTEPLPNAAIVQHAIDELTAYGKTQDEITRFAAVIQAFSDLGYSGVAEEEAATIISALLFSRPLTPVTNDPAEWVLLPGSDSDGGGIWQNKRDPSLFSTDGGQTYYSIERIKAAAQAATSSVVTTSTSKSSLA